MAEQTMDTNGMILNARVDGVRVYKELGDGDSNFALTLTQDGRQYTLPPYPIEQIDRFRIGKIDPRFVALDEDGKATDTRVQAVLKEARDAAACSSTVPAGRNYLMGVMCTIRARRYWAIPAESRLSCLTRCRD